eukprot:1572096-Rhodomonas_salina.1
MAELQGQWGGMLITPLGLDGLMMFWRPQLSQSMRWGGNPNEAARRKVRSHRHASLRCVRAWCCGLRGPERASGAVGFVGLGEPSWSCGMRGTERARSAMEWMELWDARG